VVGYHYGAGNHSELKNLLRKGLTIIGVLSVALTAIAITLSGPLCGIFVGYDAALFDMTKWAFILYSVSFLFCGFNIFGSSFFTALYNGLISALISFLRTMVFQTACVLILPIFWELDGVWVSIIVAELLALVLTVICLIKNKDRYHYA
jgi:Na+-driven multidrug efflux pump